MAEVAGSTRLCTGKKVEMFPGIFRTTMSYNEATMLCYFHMSKGASIPLHKHEAVQNGFVIKGKVRFIVDSGKSKSIIVEGGGGYVFESNEPHGVDVLEDSEVIECFAPMRPEYVDRGDQR